MKKILEVQGMTCHHCVNRVKKIIEKFDGISDIEVSLEGKEAAFSCDESTPIDKIVKSISDFGYPATEKG